MKKQLITLNLLYLSIPLSVLVLVTAVGGIFVDATYIRETTSYAAQGIGQDMVNFLIVVPAILVSSFLLKKGGNISLYV